MGHEPVVSTISSSMSATAISACTLAVGNYEDSAYIPIGELC